jgi:hypothetical protein
VTRIRAYESEERSDIEWTMGASGSEGGLPKPVGDKTVKSERSKLALASECSISPRRIAGAGGRAWIRSTVQGGISPRAMWLVRIDGEIASQLAS